MLEELTPRRKSDSCDKSPSLSTEKDRTLSAVDGIAIVVGIIIGSGIFSSPGLALERCGSPGEVLIAWALAGILVSLISMCYCELGGMMPSNGGDFEYLNRAYGETAGFAFAFFNFFISKTGSQAIMATVFGRYFQAVLEGSTHRILDDTGSGETAVTKLCAVSLIAAITLLNCSGIKESATLSLILTCTKILLVLSVFIIAICYVSFPGGSTEVIEENLSISHSFERSKGLLGFGSSLVACLWCFDGFADANFIQEELKNPLRDLPIIVWCSVFVVCLCYMLVNVAYLSVLDTDTIIDTKAIAVQFGSTASSLFHGSSILPLALAFLVALSVAGAINGSIMTGGRAFCFNGQSGKFPRIFGRLNRFDAPWAALLAQGAWAIFLVLLPGSSFSTLLDCVGPIGWLFYAGSASALIRLRIKEPNLSRPFRVPWYPLPPVVVIVVAVVIFVSTIVRQPLWLGGGVAFVLLSVPIHMVIERRRAGPGRRGEEYAAILEHTDSDPGGS